jgi:PAS domain S-box-containing protein
MDKAILLGLFEASPDAIMLVDVEGRLVRVNRQTETLLGYARDELVGHAVEMLIPERFHSRHVGYRERYTRAPSVRSMGAGRDLAARCKDGTELSVDIMLSPVRIDSQDAVIVTLRDATERVRTEQRLAANESVFKALFEHAPDAIVAVDRTGRIVRANLQTEAMLGYRPVELLGQPIETLVPERFRAKHVGQRQGYTENPANRPMGAGLELTARRKDGSEIAVDIMLSPVQLADDGLVISVIRDVTERRKAAASLKERAEELARSNHELEMFAYVASHDLQEPLRAVASSCQVLEKRLGDKLDPDTREFLGFAVDGAKRMRVLIEDLLAFSRISRGGKLLPMALGDALRRALGNLQMAIDGARAEVVVAGDLPRVLGDVGQLAQVFQNLIGNAVKFRRADATPRIEISATRAADMWTIRIADNGIGMEPRHFERIFVLFQRLHGREEYPGTGIGLALCKKIVERHGGKIGVESTLGAGSVFTFTLTAEARLP